jgi:hypothetical protein
MGLRFPRERVGVLIAVIVSLGFARDVAGEQLQQARVTQVVNDVKLLPSQRAPRPAEVNDEVKQGTAVRTGTDSRTELTFTDLTITRLGSNTVFSFKPGTRDLKINSGAMLIQIPPGTPEVKVSTAAVSAAISGGTAIFDAATGKFMILEGNGRVWRTGHPENVIIVHAGEIVWLTSIGQIHHPDKFNVKRVIQTSLLMTHFPPLPNLDLIEDVIQQQEGGDLPSLPEKTDNEIISQRSAALTPTPGPTQSEFGSPPTIAAPNPYAIGADTIIITDPTIISGVATDQGKIYRGPSKDGAFSAWAFGSTTPFDTTSGFDSEMSGSSAVFKFAALQLIANPTVDTSNGGQTSLALLAVDSITSGAPGGVLTFSGIENLVLATQNGSITLGPEISFNVQGLTLYARGAGSDLTLGSDVTASSQLHLFAQHDVILTSMFDAPAIKLVAGNNITMDHFTTDQTIETSDGHVLVQAGNDIAATDRIAVNRKATSTSTNLDVTFNAGNDLTVGSGFLGNGFTIRIDNSGENNFSSGASITTSAGGNITVNGSPGFTSTIDNSGGSTLGGDALIHINASSLTTAGNFSASINNQNGSVINGNAGISINIAGDIGSGGDAQFQIMNGSTAEVAGGHIAGKASIDVTAADITSNSVLAEINSSNGGSVGSNASINLNVSGTVTTAEDVALEIVSSTPALSRQAGTAAAASLNTIDINGGTYQVGGTFLASISGGDGTITLSTASLHADTVKVGALGTNGVLNIGGGPISADTLLKLYASGSNGTINFNSSVTLSGNSAKIIAANTINIFDGVVLTINGPVPASIYTNNPNYALASGGNGVHSGTIAGTAGANAPQPLSNAPGFDDPAINAPSASRTKVTTAGSSSHIRGRGKRHGAKSLAKISPSHLRAGIRVADTNQLRDLIDRQTSHSNRANEPGTRNHKSLADKADTADNVTGSGYLRSSSAQSAADNRFPLR